MSFCQKLIEAADARPDKVAMSMFGPDGSETTTFGEMLTEARSLAYRLGQERIEFGDRVALIGENHPHWATAYLGVIYHGAVATSRLLASGQPMARHDHRRARHLHPGVEYRRDRARVEKGRSDDAPRRAAPLVPLSAGM
jgi:acyl-coenzyme A synthetase/AMP-(fatty) acid ligase